MKTLVSIIAVAAALARLTPAWATSYNATDMFQITANPGAVWSYLDGSGNLLTQTTEAGKGSKVTFGWWNGNGFPVYSGVSRNETGHENLPPYRWPQRALLMDGQSIGGIVRFTVPTAGVYKISGGFVGLNTECTVAHPVGVAVNGVSVWSATVTTYWLPVRFHLRQALAAGDVVDFSNGHFRSPDCLGTGLVARLDGP
jgi:hypothetical protein